MDKHVINYEIKTNFSYVNKTIEHILYRDEKEVMKWIYKTLEKSTYDALIELGWTPPLSKEDNK